jgi:tetratricopeptide (TPR) repeat protein
MDSEVICYCDRRRGTMLALWVLFNFVTLSDGPSLQISSARADDTPYAEAVDLGISEFKNGNFAEARAHFAKAHALSPNARTLRGLGMAEFELKNYRECILNLEAALASQVKPLDGELRSETANLLARARGYVAQIRLELEPATATLSVDGVPAALGEGGALLLAVGDHTLEVRASGRTPSKRTLKINGGEQLHLRLALAPPEAPVQPSRTAKAPLYKNPWLWTAVGVVLAGAAAGAAVAGSRAGATRNESVYEGNSGAAVLVAP